MKSVIFAVVKLFCCEIKAAFFFFFPAERVARACFRLLSTSVLQVLLCLRKVAHQTRLSTRLCHNTLHPYHCIHSGMPQHTTSVPLHPLRCVTTHYIRITASTPVCHNTYTVSTPVCHNTLHPYHCIHSGVSQHTTSIPLHPLRCVSTLHPYHCIHSGVSAHYIRPTSFIRSQHTT